jgi:CRP/FNR family transcriptional regulator
MTDMENISDRARKFIIENSSTVDLPKGQEILREGQYVKVIPLVLKGLIKVFTRKDGKELLLYYIKPNESCIMSFMAGRRNDPSVVYAITEEETRALLLPSSHIDQWIRDFPELNELFFQQYGLRYLELLETINHVIFEKLDSRLMAYLNEKKRLTEQEILKLSHREIAADLGTAREVVTRVLKKLEHQNMIVQKENGIKIISR